MAALKTERRIFMWRIKPAVSPADATATTDIAEIVQILTDARKNGKAFAHISAEGRLAEAADKKDPKNCIYIADLTMSPKTDSFTILINRGDPEVANPSFLNPVKQTVTTVPPGRDEVQGWSAHLVIKLTPDAIGRHRACMEQIPNVSSTLVTRFLEALIDASTEGNAKYIYKKMIKKGKKFEAEERPYKLRLGMSRVPSENLKSDLEEGVLTEVILIKTKPQYSGPGSPAVVSSVKEKLTISTKKIEKASALDYIKSVSVWGKDNNYDEVQLTVRGLPGNMSSSPRFDLEKADALETLYHRSYRLTGFQTMLESCYPKISTLINSRMITELHNSKHW